MQFARSPWESTLACRPTCFRKSTMLHKAKTMNRPSSLFFTLSFFFFFLSFFLFSFLPSRQTDSGLGAPPIVPVHPFARSIGRRLCFLGAIVKARRISGIKLTLPRKSLIRLSDYCVMLIWFSPSPLSYPQVLILERDRYTLCRCFDTDSILSTVAVLAFALPQAHACYQKSGGKSLRWLFASSLGRRRVSPPFLASFLLLLHRWDMTGSLMRRRQWVKWAK